MFRILITDTKYKHAIALARYLKKDLPEVHLTAQWKQPTRVPRWYACFDDFQLGTPLDEVLNHGGFSMVIPVGAGSVLKVSRACAHLAVLPSLESLESAYDKVKTLAIAARLGIPVPKTQFVRDPKELVPDAVTFPAVVKLSREGAADNVVGYCYTIEEVKREVEHRLRGLRDDTGVLVQEFIPGGGCGFFALFHNGMPLRIFMHERLREFPPSGGPSTAARSIYSTRLRELGLKLLSELKWNGVAMVEFRLDSRSHDFVLMEVNGKFWGSLELGLHAGVNFGADLVRLFRGEKLSYSEDYDRDLSFFWPLDGDIRSLWHRGAMGRMVVDYRRQNTATNLGQSLRADIWKTVRLFRDLVVTR